MAANVGGVTKSGNSPYRGRFAPSPTGPLHFGSLIAAVGSYVDARAGGGEWLVRMEDLDPPREVPGAADEILRTLAAFGLTADGSVLRQSTRASAYAAALATAAVIVPLERWATDEPRALRSALAVR